MKSTGYPIQQMFSLQGRNILITGAAGQLGAGLVGACLGAGARVVAGDADAAALNRTAERWGWPRDRMVMEACDVRCREQVESLFALGSERFSAVDGLVNNAGVSVFEPFLERSEEALDWVMDVNLKGTFFCIQAFARQHRDSAHKASIVNVASHYGLVSPDPRIYTDCARRNSEIYGATKAGVIQMTRYFAVHLADQGVRVNGVAPGGIRNPDNPQGEDFQGNYSYRCPMGRMGEIHEMVGAALFLLSPAASYVNGQTIVIDGGTTAW